jgi:hypothetical protein
MNNAGIRVQVPLVIEMTPEQLQAYAADYGLADLRAKTIVDDVRSYVLSCVQDSAAFTDGGADVSIK